MKSSYDSYQQVAALRKELADRQKAMNGDDLKIDKEAAAALEKKIDRMEKGSNIAPGFGPVNRDLARLIFSVESADMRPVEAVRSAVQQNCDALDKDLVQWQQLNEQDIPSFNAMLVESKATALPVVAAGMGGCRR